MGIQIIRFMFGECAPRHRYGFGHAAFVGMDIGPDSGTCQGLPFVLRLPDAGGFSESPAEQGRMAVENASGRVRQMLGDTPLVFLFTGLLDGMATGAAPAIARIANEAGASVHCAAMLPGHTHANAHAFEMEAALALWDRQPVLYPPFPSGNAWETETPVFSAFSSGSLLMLRRNLLRLAHGMRGAPPGRMGALDGMSFHMMSGLVRAFDLGVF